MNHKKKAIRKITRTFVHMAYEYRRNGNPKMKGAFAYMVYLHSGIRIN